MADLLVEVRFEELPVSYIRGAAAALEKGVTGLLEGVPHGDTRVFSTPRRIAVAVADVELGRPREEQLQTGPTVSIAKKDGEWTKAAEGFARGKGLSPDDLEIVEGPKGPVIAARVQTGGETTVELVAAGLEGVVLGVSAPKSMRWGNETTRWARPLHGVLAVFDGVRIATSVAGIETTDTVVGHRRSTVEPAPVTDTASYLSSLRESWVEPDRDIRRAAIVAGLAAKAEALGVEVGGNEALVDEVTDLVEWPVFVATSFDASLLDLPPKLLEESMQVHQRTFSTWKDGKLSHHVLVVSNNPEGDEQTIAEGNARVLAARFHDAQFFLQEDRKKGLESFREGLARMRWVRGLGTMADKQTRVELLAGELAPHFGADEMATLRAGTLCKLDLVSGMVGEFPKLQGHMGRLYAEHAGEPDSVSLAIEEHYLPRHAADRVPASPEARALALADRLDTLAGCFGIGMVPTGSADPQGLRRAANGVLSLVLHEGTAVSLRTLFAAALSGYTEGQTPLEIKRPKAEVLGHLQEFTLGRLKATLHAAGHRTDLVEAVVAAGGDDPVQIRARVEALGRLSESGEFSDLMTAFKRVLNISKDHTDPSYDPGTFLEEEERALEDGVVGAETALQTCLANLDIDGALVLMQGLRPRVDAYFDKVLVMAEEPELRAARLGLLCRTSQLFLTVADFRRISAGETP
jgi:glycyl-tRNA synthetase beta chain